MVKQGTDEEFKSFIDNCQLRWSYANSILYGMCREKPRHDLKDVAASKLFLISRGFFDAEANADSLSEDEGYYYNVIAPRLQSESTRIDHYTGYLNEDCRTIAECRPVTLEAHKYLMDLFAEFNIPDNHVLSARYLHFHCPGKVFLYSRKADERVSGIVTLEGKREKPDKCDDIYLGFFDKMLELHEYLLRETGIYRSTIEINRFLTA